VANQLDLKTKLAVANYLQAHIGQLKGKTYVDIAKTVHTDTGHEVPKAAVQRIIKGLALDLGKREPKSKEARNMSGHHSALAVLAKIVRQLCNELGTNLSDFEKTALNQIVTRNGAKIDGSKVSSDN
jgi:hypothetical protein